MTKIIIEFNKNYYANGDFYFANTPYTVKMIRNNKNSIVISVFSDVGKIHSGNPKHPFIAKINKTEFKFIKSK